VSGGLPFLVHGLTLSLTWFLAVNVAACVAVLAAARLLLPVRGLRPPTLWIALRLLPAAAATGFVLLLFVPSYWKYEPREFVEGFDLTLAVAGAAGAAVIALALVRGAGALRSASRRTAAWMQHARPITINGTLPAFAIDADQPLIALVGVWRPRLLVTRGLIDALTGPELDAAIAHERGHHVRRDNLKRLLMRASPDLLSPFAIARTVERRWAAAAEHQADRMTGDCDPAARCALASALVKVARLTPISVPAAEPISTLIGGGDIASRVRILLDDRLFTGEPSPRVTRWVAGAFLAVISLIAYAPLLHLVHEITEVAVRSLP
jgi:Zn-dependent protease with chaperone function